MGVASHLGIQLDEYDARIRTFIPRYERMLDVAADAVAGLKGRSPVILDLGIGSGALSARCLTRLPAARIVGIDEDRGMLELARRRLGTKLTAVACKLPHVGAAPMRRRRRVIGAAPHCDTGTQVSPV